MQAVTNEINSEVEGKSDKIQRVADAKEAEEKSEFPKEVPYLLIGGGTASFAAYRAIKSRDPRAKVLIVTDEDRTPYMRPPLSKEVWYAEKQPEVTENDLKFQQWNGRERSLFYEPDQFYTPVDKLTSRSKGGIAVLKGHKVVKLDPDKQVVFLDDGRQLGYQKCLIATGGKAKKLPVFDSLPGDKVSVYRNVEDYVKLNDIVEGGKLKKVVVVGGGFLGSELACSLASVGRKSGFKIAHIFPEDGPLRKVMKTNNGYCVIPTLSLVFHFFLQRSCLVTCQSGRSKSLKKTELTLYQRPTSRMRGC